MTTTSDQDAVEQNSADESGTMAVLKPALAQIAEDIDASFDALLAVAARVAIA